MLRKGLRSSSRLFLAQSCQLNQFSLATFPSSQLIKPSLLSHAVNNVRFFADKKTPDTTKLEISHDHSSCSSGDHDHSVNLGDIKGTRGDENTGTYAIFFTCGVCETKVSRTFTKHAYHKGVVIIRCPGCDNQHLIADNFNWFGEENQNIEDIMREKGQDVQKIITDDSIEFIKQ
mmetsp:Transcript_63178/g.72441  ORF Transcript_63178/g.72441 Transcript_63178/m.72441 type:complete len:175 (+) Transcript_63178:72-596(+)